MCRRGEHGTGHIIVYLFSNILIRFSSYIGYVSKYVKFLLAQGCHVILVFDGRPLPAKKDIHDTRREHRGRYQQLGEQLMRQGLVDQAQRAFSRGTELTRDVVEKTIQV